MIHLGDVSTTWAGFPLGDPASKGLGWKSQEMKFLKTFQDLTSGIQGGYTNPTPRPAMSYMVCIHDTSLRQAEAFPHRGGPHFFEDSSLQRRGGTCVPV